MSCQRGHVRAIAVCMSAVLTVALYGCTHAGGGPGPAGATVADSAAHRADPSPVTAYPWCDAPPLPDPDADYRVAITDMNRELDVPVHRLRLVGLRVLPDATELAPIELDPERGVLAMSPEAAEAWILMQAAARADGVALVPLSAYRSPRLQRWIFSRRLADGDPVENVLRTSLPPGFSEHHTGDAIDIGTPEVPTIATAFAETEAYAWLTENAARYCFELSYPDGNAEGLDFEPWHWRFVRPSSARGRDDRP